MRPRRRAETIRDDIRRIRNGNRHRHRNCVVEAELPAGSVERVESLDRQRGMRGDFRPVVVDAHSTKEWSASSLCQRVNAAQEHHRGLYLPMRGSQFSQAGKRQRNEPTVPNASPELKRFVIRQSRLVVVSLVARQHREAAERRPAPTA